MSIAERGRVETDPPGRPGDRPLVLGAPSNGPRTVVVVPSVAIPVPGAAHFETRLLFLLRLLREPDTRLVYVTSGPLPDTVVDHAFDIVGSLPAAHARRRLTLLDCGATDPTPLTGQVLRRPDLIERIRRAVAPTMPASLVAFNNTALERELAGRLGADLYGCDPDLAHLGTKSGARTLFRAAGVRIPDGVEHLRDAGDVADALADLRARNPALGTAVVKLDDGVGGGGNVRFPFAGAPGPGLARWIRAELPRRATAAAVGHTWESFVARIASTGAVVEHLLDRPGTRSPSAQVEISPDGTMRSLSTHDQVLSGPSGQTFVGCVSPADPAYRAEIRDLARRAAQALAARSVTGIVSIDVVCEPTGTGWRGYAVDANLRMGGGTAPYFMTHGLVDGGDPDDSGTYVTPEGEPRCYAAYDRYQRDGYRLLGPDDVIDLAVRSGRHYRDRTRTGVAFYLLGGLADTGRIGIVAVERDRAAADALCHGMLADLDTEARRRAARTSG